MVLVCTPVVFFPAGVVVVGVLILTTTTTQKKMKNKRPMQGQIHRQARIGVTRSIYARVCYGHVYS